MRAQFKERKHIPVWLTEHLLRQGEIHASFNTMLAFPQLLAHTFKAGAERKKKNV